MLRTNHKFLAYIQELYELQERRESIIIKQFRKGQKLICQHENATKVMLVKEGITKCFFSEDNDKEYILEFLGKGEIIGDIELIRKISCLCNIEAMTDVTAYAIDPYYLSERLKTDLQLNNLLLNVFAERIINTSSRASYQQLYTIEHSLGKLLELQSKQQITISKEDMASYLGISVRSLNRTLKKISE
ncbi:Crp/Fnr family transcriptional regulator [Chryseobacterium sp. 2R14A]|uniref:Crp/Fnr family transcriptional regulator n=1 Tax=Chryseobacterium sp. 2R14A TaxID=3380353 RepID=UPI003CEE7C4D